MKSQYVNELRNGDTVKEQFILAKKTLKEKKDGGAYALIDLSDRSGVIEGILWDNVVELLNRLTTGDFVFVSGTVNEYNDRLQVVVNSIKRVDESDIDPQDYLPRCREDINKVMTEIQVYRKRIKNVHLKKLIDAFFENDEFVRKFRLAPAAKRAHHACLGGLAVHTLTILKLIMHVQTVYDFLDIDLLLTAGMLHDIGKIDEYLYTTKLDISTAGRLFGHIVLGYGDVARKIEAIPDFPEKLRYKVLHMIISHHGQQEWGSPREPLFMEALVLHFLDNLDSKVEMIRSELIKSKGSDKEWSDFHHYLERELYLK